MLPEQNDGNDHKAGPVNDSQLSRKPYRREKNYCTGVEETGKPQSGCNAKTNRNGIKPLFLVEFTVLQRVNDVEAR